MTTWRIAPVTAAETYKLRKSELRDGTNSDRLDMDGDELATTFHLGVFGSHPAPVGVSTWLLRNHPDKCDPPGFQLRGMATDPLARGVGVGRSMLQAGIDECVARGAGLVWARSRVTAVPFYEANGFATHGPIYTDLWTGIEHQDVIRFVP